MGQYELGQDIEKVREVAAGFRRQATAMDRAHQEALDAIATLRRNWGGSDFTSYDTRARKAAALIADAARTVRKQADDLGQEIDEQVRASSLGGPGGTGPQGPDTPTEPADPYDPDHPMNDDVHDEDTPIPGVGPGEDYVPQGLFIDEDGNIYTTMYDKDDVTSGVLFIQDPDGNVIAQIPLEGIDHYGGVAVDGDSVYVSGGGEIQRYSLAEMQGLGAGETAQPLDSVHVDASSTITYHDGHIWAAHHNPDGSGAVISYPIGADGQLQSVEHQPLLPIFPPHDDAVADSGFDGPGRTQGIAVDDDYVYVASSLNRDDDDSTITRYDRHTGDHVEVSVPSNMLEGIALHDGTLVQLYESGSNKYDGDGASEPRETYSHIHVD